jgi:hypothetical protein
MARGELAADQADASRADDRKADALGLLPHVLESVIRES